MKVVVCGLGKVGLPLLYHLHENLVHSGIGFDTDERLVRKLGKESVLPYEPNVGSWDLTSSKTPLFTNVLHVAMRDRDAAFIIVPTPQKGDRLSGDLVRQAIGQVREVNAECLILVVSTLDPREASDIIKGPNIVYTPVFIRLGHVVEDLENQPFLLVGCDDAYGENQAAGFWRWNPSQRPIFRADPVTIATAKLALNATLSMRVAWANDVAVRAKGFGADPEMVAKIIAADPRIGPSHNFPGWPPSGPCLPRDLDCFTSVLGLGIAEVAKIAHYQVHHRIVNQVCDDIADQAGEHPRVLILGATYNPDAQDWTGSLGLALQKACEKRGWEHLVYDPVPIETSFPFTTSEVETEQWAMGGQKSVILCTSWEQCERVFKSIKMASETFGGSHVFFDLTWRRQP